MSQLVPCPSCSRHVRLSTSHCPFCESTLDVRGLSEQYAPRRGAIQAGVKRAVVFAVGASMAAACGDDVGQAIYGAPVAPTTEEPGSSTSAEESTEAATDTSGAEIPTFAALYGAPPPSASSTEGGDIAIYGAPVPPDAGGTQATEDGGPSDAGTVTSEPAVDAATSSAATVEDAGELDASLGPDTEPTSVALYGGPPLSN